MSKSSRTKVPNKPVLDLFGVPIEIGDTVVFGKTSPTMGVLAWGTVVDKMNDEVQIKSSVSNVVLKRSPRNLVNIEGFHEFRAEWVL